MIEVIVKGDTAAARSIEDLVGTLKNPEKIYDAIGFAMQAETQLRFKSGTDIEGQAFKPSIRAGQQGGKTLVDTGALRSSITYLATTQGVEWGAATGPTSHKAPILNFGGTIRPKQRKNLKFQIGKRWVFKSSVFIPRRQFIGFNDHYEKLVSDTIIEFLESQVR